MPGYMNRIDNVENYLTQNCIAFCAFCYKSYSKMINVD